jgi:hypothetical protein
MKDQEEIYEDKMKKLELVLSDDCRNLISILRKREDKNSISMVF